MTTHHGQRGGRETFPLSFGQEKTYWGLRQGGIPAHSLHASLRIDGPLNAIAFNTALHTMVLRHDALRLRIAPGPSGLPGQWLAAPPDPASVLTRTLVKSGSETQFITYAARVGEGEFSRPWRLAENPHFRFTLLRFSPEVHAFLANFPRVTVDGRSRAVFLRELWQTYTDVRNGGPTPGRSGDLPASIRRQRERFAHRSATTNLAYWTSKFQAIESGSPRSEDASGDDSDGPPRLPLTRDFTLRGEELLAFRSNCRASTSTAFQWALARFAAEIFRITSRPHIDVLVPMDTRETADLALMGRFAITMPLLVHRSDEPAGILRNVKAEMMQTMRHRHLRYADLERARASRRTSVSRRRGVVTAAYDEHTEDRSVAMTGGVVATSEAIPLRLVRMSDGIDLAVNDFGRRLEVTVRFDPRDHDDAAADEFIVRLAGALVTPLATTAAVPDVAARPEGTVR
ncbi:condensation domain-containing protein [Streptomyces sp. NPDC002588]|uniref:condensation domain-containing protein n=1 Tax=Streptomyces sp. NPDC002588 TaxID=3154419 RepID=UPI00332E4F7C